MKKNGKYVIWALAVVLFLLGYLVVDGLLFDGVRPKAIDQGGFQGNYYVKETPEKRPAILLIGGGPWGDYWGQKMAQQGFAGLSLPYTRMDGLPELPEEIPIEYFENALKWMKNQPAVDPEKMVVMGASRNAELALVVGSLLPDLVSGVVAYAPGSVVWSNTVLPFNSDEIKPSWTYRGAPVAFVPMPKIEGNNTGKIETLSYWKAGLAKKEAVAKAAIPVEKINGSVLLFSGLDDQVWPSAEMADQIEKRLEEKRFQHPVLNVKFANAGHLVSSHPDWNSDVRTGTMTIDGKTYEYEFGGTKEGDQLAKQSARTQLMEFLMELKENP